MIVFRGSIDANLWYWCKINGPVIMSANNGKMTTAVLIANK